MLNKSMKPPTKGMGELFSLLHLIQNKEEAAAYLEQITGKIARDEELVGAYNTKEKADRYLAEAEVAKKEAEKIKSDAVAYASTLRAEVADEAHTSRDTVDSLTHEAEIANKESQRLLNEAKDEHISREAIITARDTHLNERQVILEADEYKLASDNQVLVDKAKQATKLFS